MTMHSAAIDSPVRTACPYCGVGCGVLATARADGTAEIAGDPEHPANLGRLCVKGAALGETLSLDDRLLHPLINGERASWDAALDLVADRFRAAIDEHGPDSVAFYVSGQILTEDYYAANKLMKGFIGSANIDTNSRLCMASSVAGHKRAFGADTVPGTYEDLELADLVVLVGSNLAWCHPVLFQRLSAAREKRGTKIVVIDPRRTATCEIADQHLALAPGSDVALFTGLLSHVVGANASNTEFIARHTSGFKQAFTATQAMSLTQIARETGLGKADLFAFYDLFAATERVVTVYSQGVNQSSAGTDKVNAIINCHLATGRIGRPGMGPFSVTGQPNAMGGRETGGLATMLAAHMDLDNAEHRRIVQSFWGSPAIAAKPGLKAVDMFQAVADGRIKALWIMATNPVDSMPEADGVRAALAACPFVVVSDVIRHTDTTALGHVLLPSAAWGEKNGTVTNSERRISRQRAFLPTPGEARPDWWQMAEVATRMGYGKAFAWGGPHDIFAEYATLTGVENAGSRDLDISAYGAVSARDYDALSPFQWPQAAGQPAHATRFFADGQFYTPDRRARFIPTAWRKPASAPCPDYPFVLNTGRVRDQWHTMTRTGKTPRLMRHSAEPFVEIHPEDAAAAGIADGRLATVSSRHGRVLVRAQITSGQRRGSLYVPIHWTDVFASAGRIDSLVHANADPVSGQPELKYTPVAIRPFETAWHGFAVTRVRPDTIPSDYWVVAPAKSGWTIELAAAAPRDWELLALQLFGAGCADPEQVPEFTVYNDARSGGCRIAAFDGERLLGALFVSRGPPAVSRDWLASLLDDALEPAGQAQVLAGRPGGPVRDRGPIVCSCFAVGRNDIIAAARAGGVTVQAIGDATRAGTNCGSCRPEIAAIVERMAAATAAG